VFEDPDISLLRISSAGSVDNGKSSLIGRLLYDSKSIFEDQYSEVERSSNETNSVNLAHLTDGLKDERELGITIDVAYRYFATPKRKFIIADTPGHYEFTRNMVTGASNADVLVLLVDVETGFTEQSKRHLFIANMLAIPNVILCVNKMDLVEYDQKSFTQIEHDFINLTQSMTFGNAQLVPISALKGDNVVSKSTNMPWYRGLSLLEQLERMEPKKPDGSFGAVMVQSTVDSGGKKWHLGHVLEGKVNQTMDFRHRSNEVVFDDFRSCQLNGNGAVSNAPISFTVANDNTIERGTILWSGDIGPQESKSFKARLCWFAETGFKLKGRYALKSAQGVCELDVLRLLEVLDVETLEFFKNDGAIEMNTIFNAELYLGRERINTPYNISRSLGSFILIDLDTNETAAAGMIL